MNVEIPGVGVVEFPEGMTQEQIAAALQQYRAPQKPEPIGIASGAAYDPETGLAPWAPKGVAINPETGQAEDLTLPNANVPTGRGAAFVLGGGQGATFGLADEATAPILAATRGTGTDYELARMREAIRRGQNESPGAYYGGMIPASVATSMGVGSALGLGKAGLGMGGRVIQGVGQGAAEGAAFGFGSGEGMEDRTQKALQYGSIGGIIGGAAPLAVTGARNLADAALAGPVAAMRSAPSQSRAGAAIVRALESTGKTADEVAAATEAAAREGQPEFAAVDVLGRQGARLLGSVARTTPEASEAIQTAMMSRQASQGERLGRIISGALQAPETAAARQAALTKARDDAADVAYSAARADAGPVDVRGAIAAIDDRIGPMQGSGVTGDGIDAALSKYRARLAAQPGGPAFKGASSVELSDFDRVLGVKRDVQDAIGAAVRAGRNNEARELGKLVSQLDQALEASSPSYRAANDEFAKASRVIDQIEAGKASATPRARQEDVIATYQGLTPDQQAAFRVGRADAQLGRIGAAAEGANKARPLTSGKAQSELPAMAQDAELLRRQLARENQMFATGSKVLGGSETAERLADDALLSQDAMGVIGNLLSGNVKGAAGKLGIKALSAAQGQNAATRQLIAQALLSQDVRPAIAQAIAQQQRATKQNKVVEALLRASPRLLSGR